MSVMGAGPGAPAFFKDLSSCAPFYLVQTRSKHSAPVTRQGFQFAPDRNKANNEECLTRFLEDPSWCFHPRPHTARSHCAVFLRCTAEQVNPALQRLRSECGNQCRVWSAVPRRLLVVVGLGVRRLTSSVPFPLPTTLCVLFKLLPFSRLCFFFLLVSSQVAPPFPHPFVTITSSHLHTAEETQPVLTLGTILFVFHGSYCLKITPKLFIGCVWKLKRLLTSVSSHCETFFPAPEETLAGLTACTRWRCVLTDHAV